MNFSRRNGCCCMSGIFFALNSINCCCSSVFTICFKQNEISSAIEIQTALIRRKAGTALMPKLFNTFPEETGRFWSKVRRKTWGQMFYIFPNDILWLHFCPFQIILSFSIACNSSKLWKIIKKVTMHALVQVWNHASDCGIVKMKCTGSLGSWQLLCKCVVFIFGSTVPEQALHHQEKIELGWTPLTALSSQCFPSSCCSVHGTLLQWQQLKTASDSRLTPLLHNRTDFFFFWECQEKK